MTDSDKWQQVLTKIGLPHNTHFSSQEPIIENDDITIHLNATANIDKIRLDKTGHFSRAIQSIYGDCKINYQMALATIPDRPKDDQPIKVISKRKKRYFVVDNELFRAGHTAKMKPGALSVYLALVMHADYHEMTCYPSLAKLAALCGTSKSTVGRHIKRLKELGYIEIEKSFLDNGSQTSNLIYILEYPIL